MTKAFGASRYERGGDDDYINCPFNKSEYENFIEELVNADKIMRPAYVSNCDFNEYKSISER